MAITFVNISKKDFLKKYKKVYRFITLERFIEMIKSKDFVFINPSSWTDPFEKFFLEREFIINGKTSKLPAKDRIFAVCVSRTVTSEAFWKVYSPKEDGIRLTFDTEKLLDFLESVVDSDTYIGKVDYQKTDSFHKFSFDKKNELIEEINNKTVGEQQIRLFLLKRNSFEYEDEIRIILYPKNKPKDNKIYKIHTDIAKFTTEFMLHPKIGKNHAAILKEYFKSLSIKLLHSNLYSELKTEPVNLNNSINLIK